MNFWNNQGCGCNKYEEEKNYYFKCEMVEKNVLVKKNNNTIKIICLIKIVVADNF